MNVGPSGLARTRRSDPARAERAAASIAVLPFEYMSGDPEQEYFADGIVGGQRHCAVKA